MRLPTWVLRLQILRWLLRATRPFGLEVQVVRVQARPDFSAEISRWTADEFGDPKGAVDAFLVLAPTAERSPPERPSNAIHGSQAQG